MSVSCRGHIVQFHLVWPLNTNMKMKMDMTPLTPSNLVPLCFLSFLYPINLQLHSKAINSGPMAWGVFTDVYAYIRQPSDC